MRLPVSIDVITIAACIPIILAAVHNGSDGSAENSAYDRAGPCADSGKDGPSKSAGTRADCDARSSARYCMIISRIRRAPTKSKTAHSNS
jgi:hypothetical protein